MASAACQLGELEPQASGSEDFRIECESRRGDTGVRGSHPLLVPPSLKFEQEVNVAKQTSKVLHAS